MSPSGETNEAVQPPRDTIAPIGCPERSANAETPSNTTDSFAIFNGVVLQQSKRQMMSLMRSRTAATAPRITLCTPLRWWHSSEATRESHQHFTLASPHAADPRGLAF